MPFPSGQASASISSLTAPLQPVQQAWVSNSQNPTSLFIGKKKPKASTTSLMQQMLRIRVWGAGRAETLTLAALVFEPGLDGIERDGLHLALQALWACRHWCTGKGEKAFIQISCLQGLLRRLWLTLQAREVGGIEGDRGRVPAYLSPSLPWEALPLASST